MCDQQSLRSACAYAQSDQSICRSLEYSMSVKLLTEHHLEFLSLKGCCTGWSESTLVKMPHYWKPHVTAHVFSSLFSSSDGETLEEAPIPGVYIVGNSNIKITSASPAHNGTYTCVVTHGEAKARIRRVYSLEVLSK